MSSSSLNLGVSTITAQKSILASSVLFKKVSLIRSSTANIASKSCRRVSRNPKIQTRLVFHYGPTYYRGAVLHRKVTIAPIAEHFQKRYPTILVYYHPTNEYNTLSVKLQNGEIFKCNLSNAGGSKIRKAVYRTIDKAIQRYTVYPNLVTEPFRDPICLMTHNLDVDYDLPWYRTTFNQPNDEGTRRGTRVSFMNYIVAPCQVEYTGGLTKTVEALLWNKYREKIESSEDFTKLLQREAPHYFDGNISNIRVTD